MADRLKFSSCLVQMISVCAAQIDQELASVERYVADNARLNVLFRLTEALTCRHQTLLAYFDETIQFCGYRDLCDVPRDLFEATEVIRKALSEI